MSTIRDEWIFYLKLAPKLNENFLALDENFKRFGYNLIPVSFPNLLELIKDTDNVHVVVVVGSQREAAYYMRNVSKPIKNLLRFGRITLSTASSFGFINESAKLTVRSNYDFYKLPIKATDLVDKILSTVLSKAVENTKWPGGVRPRMTINR